MAEYDFIESRFNQSEIAISLIEKSRNDFPNPSIIESRKEIYGENSSRFKVEDSLIRLLSKSRFGLDTLELHNIILDLDIKFDPAEHDQTTIQHAIWDLTKENILIATSDHMIQLSPKVDLSK